MKKSLHIVHRYIRQLQKDIMMFKLVATSTDFIFLKRKPLKTGSFDGYGLRIFRGFIIEHNFFCESGSNSYLLSDIDVLNLSDEEFMELIMNHFTTKLELSKKRHAMEFLHSKSLPPYVEERL